MARNVICISRAFGAAGEEVGQLAADRLGYRCLDGEILARAAEKGDLDAATVADSEQRHSFVRRMLDAMGENAAVAPEAYAYMPAQEIVIGSRQESVRGLIRAAIEEAADEGDAVIVAHAASHALTGRDGVLRVLVTGSADVRTDRVADASRIDRDASRKQVSDGDRARASYLSRFYNVADEQPSQYDLVVNTDVLTPEQAAEIVVCAAGV
jgi:cytidylate kinase